MIPWIVIKPGKLKRFSQLTFKIPVADPPPFIVYSFVICRVIIQVEHPVTSEQFNLKLEQAR